MTKKYYRNSDVTIYCNLSSKDEKIFLSKFNEAYKDKINKILKFKNWEEIRIDILTDTPFFKGSNLSKSNGVLFVEVSASSGDWGTANYDDVEDCFRATWNHNRFI